MAQATTPSKLFGQQLRRLRTEPRRDDGGPRLTLEQVGERLEEWGVEGSSKWAVRLVEVGKSRPTLDQVWALAAAVGVSPISLLTPPNIAQEMSIGRGRKHLRMSALAARVWLEGGRPPEGIPYQDADVFRAALPNGFQTFEVEVLNDATDDETADLDPYQQRIAELEVRLAAVMRDNTRLTRENRRLHHEITRKEQGRGIDS